MYKKIFHDKLPILLIIVFTLLTFFKIFTSGLYPFPGNLLVSQNFPWYSGGWNGYDPWTTTKATLASDAIRQHIPWHRLTFEYIKQNISIPLWNPYNYAGTPHFANIQTFIFNPLNLVFLALPLSNAWIIFVILQFPLALFFMYLFTRSLGLSKESSIFSGLAFVFSSYFIIWFEIGIVGYSVIWLPLILYSIQNLLSNFKLKYLFLLILSSTICIFSGHIQTAIFIFFISIGFWIFKSYSLKRELRLKSLSLAIIWIIFTILITAIQTLPSLELYLNSPLMKPFSKDVFNTETMPFVNLLTLFAPDFFGNPANKNLWTLVYGDGTPNIGALPLFFSILALFQFRKKEVKFFLILSIISVLFATKSPLYILIKSLSVPFLTGTSPVRTMFAFSFGMSILAAFGLESFVKSKKININTYLTLATFLAFYVIIIMSTFFIPMVFKNSWTTNLLITRRNLVIPFFCFLILLVLFALKKILSRSKLSSFRFEVYIIIVITLSTGIYQFNKTSPFSKIKNFFPNHPLINWLQENGSVNRFYGEGVSRIDNNFATYYHIYTPEGYGVFRITRYAELMASQDTGRVPVKYNRADADFSEKNDQNKKRLQSLLGVKYIVVKDDFARDAKISDAEKPNDDVKIIWQDGKFKVYERNKPLPRFFLSSNYVIAKSDQEILDHIYDNNFDLRTIILEKKPKNALGASLWNNVELINYQPDTVSFKTTSEFNTLLFLSDAYYPGWEAKVDDNKADVYRADYAFRAVEVPKGDHQITLSFHPKSFYFGIFISIIGLITFGASLIYTLKKKLL